MPTAATIAEIRRATRHHGVTTHHQLRLTHQQISRAVAAGALLRPHLGVYVDPNRPKSPMQDLAVAVAAGGPGAAAWGRSAAALWELCRDHPPVPEIVVPRRRYARVEGAVVHRSTNLTAADIKLRDNIRVVSPILTVIDLGVVLTPTEVAEFIVTALERRLFHPRAVAVELARIARPGRTGVRVCRDALDMVMIQGRPAESVLELHFGLLARRFGLPEFEYQYEVLTPGGRFVLDVAYPDVMLAVEVEGLEWHGRVSDLDRDHRRRNQLTLAGWRILTFGWIRVLHDPVGVAAEVLAELALLAA